ncbi:MAG: protoheme IX farnesyltransferase, partial [Flavobacteriales bacterium]|nr:protoheme IX farnesyltransferase [Flavobacteriales bacterium]
VGIMLLPSVGGKNKSSAFQIMIYTFILLLVSALPYYFELVGIIGTIVILTMGIIFFWQSLRLWIKCDDTSAKKLMFGSFIYLPVVQLAMLLDKIG